MKSRHLFREGDCCPEIQELQSSMEQLLMVFIGNHDIAEPKSCLPEKAIVEKVQSTSAHCSVKQSRVLSCIPGLAFIEHLGGKYIFRFEGKCE